MPIFSLIVSPKGSVETSPQEIDSARGQNQTFICSAMGGPANVFSWVRVLDNVTVSQKADLMVLVDSASDGSEYICTVMNAAGNDSAMVILRGEWLHMHPLSTTDCTCTCIFLFLQLLLWWRKIPST